MTYSLPIATLAGADGRYPTAAEEKAVLDWAASLPKRLQAANLLAQKEADIARDAVEAMKPRYPRFGQLHERAYEKGERDLQLVLRYAAQGLVAADPEMPREKLFVWYGTIIRSAGLTPEFARESCEAAFEACRRHLPAEAFATAEPYLARMVTDVPDFPAPHKPAVN